MSMENIFGKHVFARLPQGSSFDQKQGEEGGARDRVIAINDLTVIKPVVRRYLIIFNRDFIALKFKCEYLNKESKI